MQTVHVVIDSDSEHAKHEQFLLNFDISVMVNFDLQEENDINDIENEAMHGDGVEDELS